MGQGQEAGGLPNSVLDDTERQPMQTQGYEGSLGSWVPGW